MSRPNLIFAIVVAYQPDLDVLARLLDTLEPQVQQTIVVDNGVTGNLATFLVERNDPSLRYLPLGSNLGVAAAQNAGIRLAKSQGADYVVLFDQDSEPAMDMVETLVRAATTIARQSYNVAAVGPRYTDKRQNNPPPFIRIHGLRLERCICENDAAVVPVDYLISSGCLIPMSTLDKVGAMAEELFIDYVDIEWGLRAKHFGYQSFGVCSASMRHSLGENPLHFLGRKIPLHSPLRHYYHFRNAVCLYRKDWLPVNWKIVDGWRLLLKYGFYALLAKPRHKHLWMMSLGIVHGLIGRTGKFTRI